MVFQKEYNDNYNFLEELVKKINKINDEIEIMQFLKKIEEILIDFERRELTDSQKNKEMMLDFLDIINNQIEPIKEKIENIENIEEKIKYQIEYN